MRKKITLEDILREKEVPAVGIDEKGLFFFVNKCFEKEFGWRKENLLGNVVTMIMPPHMRDAHNFGFSRFLITERPRLLNKPLELAVYCKDGTIRPAEHFITAKKEHGHWRFAALIKPKP